MKLTTKVISKRYISNEIILLRVTRNHFKFNAGQYIAVSFPTEKEAREYSIYSGENDPYLEILLKTIPEGSFSKRLANLNINDELIIEGSYGCFVMKNDEVKTKNHLFIATGTGISPFKSYISTYPELNYKVLHGISVLKEQIEPESYAPHKLIYCVSHETSDHFKGRVTDFLEHYPIDKETVCHLCGNSAMINDVSDILEKKGILPQNIRTEAFF